ncbi:prenyltransferase/squalene oxidase repeat-containing protein [Actinokineospora sp. NBRC 105648]|uniref:prenyltransferase/squalene oxidase repeat-containing protein n=1 Tax=Actinokineospora sp. NBRC 105648 TaxID=3032206 RepID=UPI0024A607D0|nr:prenyltransferase/squalene oxidase repeat-containing protein [Actinokineospora sp. NBRC 105648]GLZ38115.1 hypothetical protein Acsp05_17390 [Actinokineospora sp. NBRC 105648]
MNPSHRRALADAMAWVAAAHEATGRRGVSAGYELVGGWQPTYPETSGYLIPTMLRAADALGDPDPAERAGEIGEWLLGLQRPDGAFPGGTGTDGDPVVFDTGQIVLGLLARWERDGDRSALDAAARAVDWLCARQLPSGAWLSHLGWANTYATRVTWAVAAVWRQTGDPAHLACAHRSLDWVLDQVEPDGWIPRTGFDDSRVPWTHTTAYALRGLHRTADALGDDERAARARAPADRAALGLADLVSPLHPLLPGQIGGGFTPAADYACLTGDAQLVTVWLDTAKRHRGDELRARAAAVVDRLVELQVRQPLEPAAVGALPGSWPLSGGFEPAAFPNWATKFLADAVLNLAEATGGAGLAPAA